MDDPAGLQKTRDSEYKHPLFFGAMLNDILCIKAILEPVYPLTLDQWQAKFRRTRSPGKEIRRWLDFAEIYREYTDGMALDTCKHVFKSMLFMTVDTTSDDSTACADRE